MKGLRRQLGQLRANAVGVDDIGQDGLGAADGRLADRGPPRFEHRGCGRHVLDMQTEMGDAGWPLRVRGLQLDKRVLAHLDVDELHLPGCIDEPERLRKSHRLRVVFDGFIEIGHAEPHVIQPDDPPVWRLILGKSGGREPDHGAGDK